jgi:hypothetical protein
LKDLIPVNDLDSIPTNVPYDAIHRSSWPREIVLFGSPVIEPTNIGPSELIHERGCRRRVKRSGRRLWWLGRRHDEIKRLWGSWRIVD